MEIIRGYTPGRYAGRVTPLYLSWCGGDPSPVLPRKEPSPATSYYRLDLREVAALYKMPDYSVEACRWTLSARRKREEPKEWKTIQQVFDRKRLRLAA